MIIARIHGVVVSQDDDSGIITWESPAAIDADGANGQNGKPFAYRYPTNDGLDRLIDAGWPNESWRNVLIDDGDGHPLTDGHGNAYSSTTYRWPGRPIQTRFVDAATVPYLVVNPIVRRNARGAIIGARAVITYRFKSIDAVVADVSGSSTIGEISIAAAELLGINPSPLKGGTDDLVAYSILAGTAAVIGGETYLLQPM